MKASATIPKKKWYVTMTDKFMSGWGEARGKTNKFLHLDYNNYYGGWRMDWVNKDTSESFYSGMKRRSTKEMYAYLQGKLGR